MRHLLLFWRCLDRLELELVPVPGRMRLSRGFGEGRLGGVWGCLGMGRETEPRTWRS